MNSSSLNPIRIFNLLLINTFCLHFRSLYSWNICHFSLRSSSQLNRQGTEESQRNYLQKSWHKPTIKIFFDPLLFLLNYKNRFLIWNSINPSSWSPCLMSWNKIKIEEKKFASFSCDRISGLTPQFVLIPPKVFNLRIVSRKRVQITKKCPSILQTRAGHLWAQQALQQSVRRRKVYSRLFNLIKCVN